MALVTFTIPNLYNGVSQQPITLRLPNQGQEQLNGNSRVTDGLSKRMASELLLIDDSADLGWVGPISDNLVKKHMLDGIDDSGVPVRVELLINTSTGRIMVTYLYADITMNNSVDLGIHTYLAGSTKKDIKCLTDGDSVYVLNKNITTTMTTTGADSDTPTNKQGTLVYVQQGFFGTEYRVNIKIVDTTDNTTVISTSATTSTANSQVADVSSLQTNTIANNLKTALQTALTTAGGAFSNVTIEYTSKNWFRCYFADVTDPYGATHRIEMEAFSSTARQALYAFNGTAIDFTTLPPTAPEGYVVKIQSDASTTKDDYYLMYKGKDTGWLETKKLGLSTSIDSSTLPLKIVNLINSTVDRAVEQLTIKPREVGDTESAPDPSFVGFKLHDIFIFANRLGFLSRKNVIMSRIDEFTVFYRTTVGTALTADRVDLTATIPSVRFSNLNYAIPFDKELVIYGDNAQYSLSSNAGFDVKVASLAPLTEYESSKLCSPVNIGAAIYFPINRGDYTGVFDLSRKGDVGLTAEEATQHIPVYIKGNIVEMVNSTTENMLFSRTDVDPRIIYVQNRFVRNTQLEQNAWHKWIMPKDIIGMYVIGSKLYVTMIDDAGTLIFRSVIDISLKLLTQDELTEITFLPYVDLIKKLPIGSEVSESDILADYYVSTEDVPKLVGIDNSGFLYNTLDDINTALVTKELWVGLRFTFEYTFSQQTPAIYGEQGKTAMQYARLTLRSMIVVYTSTGKFNVLMEPTGRQPFIVRFTGNILNLAASILGRINIYTGTFKFPINNRADQVKITIQSDHPYPVTFNTVEWQGVLTTQSGRM